MSMHSYVKGIKPADAKFKKMLAIYQQCEEMQISIPAEVDAFFDGERPDESGVVVDLDVTKNGPVQEYHAEMREGFEVDITKLPKDIKIIRFVNSY
jgi:hypothetical protein